MNTLEKVRESNRIEGINRQPTNEEILEHDRFVDLTEISIDDIIDFVSVYEPYAKIRLEIGMNVIVGAHMPPLGGKDILIKLETLLQKINNLEIDVWEAHIEYETLHPFTDCNGRSGRILWYWQMNQTESKLVNLGFLHAFYYQTLHNIRNA